MFGVYYTRPPFFDGGIENVRNTAGSREGKPRNTAGRRPEVTVGRFDDDDMAVLRHHKARRRAMERGGEHLHPVDSHRDGWQAIARQKKGRPTVT